MDNHQKSKLVSDIENSLDDFFGEQDQSPPSAPPDPDKSLEKLKSAVLSIDWEISDACLSELIHQTEALLPVYENDHSTHALMRMLRALSRYIQKRKAQSHQDAIKSVMSVFASIESLVSDRQLDETSKKRLVAKEIVAFKKLKEQVEANKDGRSAPVKTDEALGKSTEIAALLDSQQFQKAMSEVEKRLNAKVEELKSQIENMRKELDLLRKS